MDKNYVTLLAGEAFLRRVAAMQQDFPFMLKGSFLTRQYLPNPSEREVNDLDWVYVGEKIDKKHDAGDIFVKLISKIIKIDVGDKIHFPHPDIETIWMDVNYAMAEDYPTINLDLCCSIWISEKEVKTIYLSIDFTFNLPLKLLPVSLVYKPVQGEAFLLKYTTLLSLQIAWKIHQTIVRPRVKDIEDLIYLLQHPSFNKQAFQETLQALVNECHAGKVNIRKLHLFMAEYIEYYKAYENFGVYELNLKAWKKKIREKQLKEAYMDTEIFDMIRALIYDSINFAHLSSFLTEFRLALNNAGFTSEIWNNLPKPN